MVLYEISKKALVLSGLLGSGAYVGGRLYNMVKNAKSDNFLDKLENLDDPVVWKTIVDYIKFAGEHPESAEKYKDAITDILYAKNVVTSEPDKVAAAGAGGVLAGAGIAELLKKMKEKKKKKK